jgi:hypothetical protein
MDVRIALYPSSFAFQTLLWFPRLIFHGLKIISPRIAQMLWICRPSESLAEDLQDLSGFLGGFADFCGQVEREFRDLSGFVAERVRTPVKERESGAGFLLRRKTPPVYLSLSLADWLHDAQLLTSAGKLSKEESLLYAASSLTELAQQVWRKASTDIRSRNIPVTWSLFKDTLEQGLGVHNVEFDAREKLSSLVQKTTVRKYAAEFRRLHDLIASEPVSGGEKVHKFLSGLKPELKRLCLVDPSHQNQIWAGCDFEKLVTFALTMEHSLSSISAPSAQGTPVAAIFVAIWALSLSQNLPASQVPAAAKFSSDFELSLAQAKSCLLAAQSRQRAYANTKRRDVSFSVGEEVLLSTRNLKLKVVAANARKLLPNFLGPFTVVKRVNAVAYKLGLPETMKVHIVFHVSIEAL